jgi:imidazole glycerol phosphate synthase glutamine amidotransferase subunit
VTAAPPPRIAVVDHGAGNLVSIEQALTTVGLEVVVAREPAQLGGCDGLVVPGVGAAEPAMATLHERGLVEPLLDWIAADRPYLGICLGMQLLFETSDEDGAPMLGVLPGRVRRLVDAPTLPHIGWNDAVRARPHPLFAGIAADAPFYFVHSYAGAPTDDVRDAVLASTTHGGTFVSAVARSATLGVQFHPERSGRDGLHLLANFGSIVAAHRDALAVPA